MRAYRVLIAEEAVAIEACIYISHTQSKARSVRIWRKPVDEVEIVRSKLGIAERGVWRYRKPSWTATGQVGVEIGRNGQGWV